MRNRHSISGYHYVSRSAKNIPIVDGDGAGRAFPSLQMTTFASNPEEIPISPVVLLNSKRVGEGGTEIVLYQNNPSVVDE